MQQSPLAEPQAYTLFRAHAQRESLIHEVHTRPYELLSAPTQATHLAFLHDQEDSLAQEIGWIIELCERFGVAAPTPNAAHFSGDFGTFRLKWERHTEFSTYTFFTQAPFNTPFRETALQRVPVDWLRLLSGELLVALHVALEAPEGPERTLEELASLFASNTVAGAWVSGNAAQAWTDYRIHADGFGRILVRSHSLRSRQAGRLIQRLLEIETYRTMAILGLPLARTHQPRLYNLETEIAELTARMRDLRDVDSERKMLQRLSELSAQVEHASAETSYRFSASFAYYQLVRNRIRDLREGRIQGLQTFDEFMQRRLAPAIHTCQSVQEQLDSLAKRLARASELLRTRVDITLEAQNRDLLESMNHRAKMQLRLQETVEGLSVVVLSYYLVGLVAYALKGAKAWGLELNVELSTALALPLVVGMVFWAVRKMKRHHLS